jgi:hypothetical protein
MLPEVRPTGRVVRAKRREIRLLLARAKELENPAVLPFMDADRRMVRVAALRARACCA